MNARRITVGILRPIGFIGVVVTAVAIGTGRNNKSLNDSKIKEADPKVPVASQGLAYATPVIIPEPVDQLTGNSEPEINNTNENSKPIEPSVSEKAQGETKLDPKPEVKKKSPNLLKLLAKLKSPPPLTAEKKEACNKVISFLEKHTPDSAFSYKSIPIFLEGVRNDEKAIQDEIKKIKFEKETAGIKSNVTSEDDYRKLAQERVVKRVHEGLIAGLDRLGVKPPAADTSTSDGPAAGNDTDIEPVTVEILAEFREMMDRLDLYRKEAVTMGTLTFPNKYAVEDVKFTLNEKSGILPNGEWGLAK